MNDWADYVVFVAFLLIFLGIGIYHALTGGKQRTTEEFFVADRKLKLIPTTISLVVSFKSSIMIVGFVAEIYVGGTLAWPYSILCNIVAIVITERLIVPWIYPLRLTSVFKYFQIRYKSKAIQVFAACLGIVGMLLNMGVDMFAVSLSLQVVTGFPLTASVPIMTAVCIMYTALGGIKAVVWTDVLQFVIMLAGTLAVLIKGFMAVGGISHAFDLTGDNDRLIWYNVSPDPTVRHSIWGIVIGKGMMWLVTYGLAQASVQRYSSVETQSKARWSVLLNIPLLMLMYCMTFLNGIAALAYFAENECDPIKGGAGQPNGILSLFVSSLFTKAHGFMGLFWAALYSGTLSSFSSFLSGSTAVAWEDILKDRFHQLSDFKAAVINRILVVVFGGVAMGISFLCVSVKGPVSQIAQGFHGTVMGPLFGMFLLAGIRVFKRIKSSIIVIGAICGLAFNLWLNIGSGTVPRKYPILPPLSIDGCDPPINVTVNVNATAYTPPTGLARFYSISYVWYTLIGTLVTMIVAVLIHLMIVCVNKIRGSSTMSTDQIPDRLFIPFNQICSWSRKVTEMGDIADDQKLQQFGPTKM